MRSVGTLKTGTKVEIIDFETKKQIGIGTIVQPIILSEDGYVKYIVKLDKGEYILNHKMIVDMIIIDPCSLEVIE